MRKSLLAVALFLTASTAVQADLYCEQRVVQVGEVKAGQRLAQRFVFRNRGPQDVEITDVHPSCGCLKPKLNRGTYAPGDEGAIEVEVNTLGQGAGPQSWGVRLTYKSAGQTGELALLLQARLVVEVDVQPGVLTLTCIDCSTSAGSNGGPLAHPIYLTDRRAKPLTVTSATSTSPHLQVRVSSPITSDQVTSWRLDLELSAACPDGRHEEVIHIQTDDPDYRDLQVPLTVVKRSRGKVIASPAEVTLREASQRVLLSAAGDEPVLVDRIETDHPSIQCRWAPGPGPRATLRIFVDPDATQPPPSRSTVRVHLKGPTTDVVTIPVTCEQRGP
jgi:hypothetical protein